MKALTLTQPDPMAYLAGCVLGDAWVGQALGLRVADRDFAEAFATAIAEAFPGWNPRVGIDERGYFLVRCSNKTGRFDDLLRWTPTSRFQIASWLRGMFDSEGNALLRRNGTSANSYGRRVAFYTTNSQTAWMVRYNLHALGIPSRVSETKNSASHKGTKTVLAIEVRGGRANYEAFAELVGSSIARKQRVLEAIGPSYQPPGHHSRIQAKGKATRVARRDAGGKY